MTRDSPRTKTLVAVLSNPPLTDGQRTLRRVALAGSILGFAAHRVVNMFAIPSHATGALGRLGMAESGWASARMEMCAGLKNADGVLLGYGSTLPSGTAREHFRAQVDWLSGQLSSMEVPIWQLGETPRHPSRWQRWTYRAHPGVSFEEAVRRSLMRVDPVTIGRSG